MSQDFKKEEVTTYSDILLEVFAGTMMVCDSAKLVELEFETDPPTEFLK